MKEKENHILRQKRKKKKLTPLVVLKKKQILWRFMNHLGFSQVRLKPFHIKYESPSSNVRLARQIKYQIFVVVVVVVVVFLNSEERVIVCRQNQLRARRKAPNLTFQVN